MRPGAVPRPCCARSAPLAAPPPPRAVDASLATGVQLGFRQQARGVALGCAPCFPLVRLASAIHAHQLRWVPFPRLHCAAAWQLFIAALHLNQRGAPARHGGKATARTPPCFAGLNSTGAAKPIAAPALLCPPCSFSGLPLTPPSTAQRPSVGAENTGQKCPD